MLEAKCLCGNITITTPRLKPSIGACHCTMCRRWGGGPLMTAEPDGEVSVSGDAHLKIYVSSEWAERGFCGQCGTHLFYRLKEDGRYFFPAGLFAADIDGVFDHQVFIDEKPAFYEFKNNTRDLTGAELFAMFTEGNSEPPTG